MLPYYRAHIEPDLRAGKNVLVVASGNSLRALIMAVEGLTPEQILKVEIPTGEPWLYELGPDLAVQRKLVLEGAPASA